jgi:orotidine-5'-phosphate decarboxylase
MRDRIIVALDVASGHEALSLARQLEGHARWVKVGMTLFYSEGPSVVYALRDLGFDVFVDLKLNDIPHQAEGAARSLAALGAGMLTVHASGGGPMIAAAVGGARQGATLAGLAAPKLIAVTVLTSTDEVTLSSLGVHRSVAEQVGLLGVLARDAGADGVVCSPFEARSMRDLWGSEALVVTPGVRPSNSPPDDQSRVMTPSQAIAQGASHLVIGRPITGAPDPGGALEAILETMEGAA